MQIASNKQMFERLQISSITCFVIVLRIASLDHVEGVSVHVDWMIMTVNVSEDHVECCVSLGKDQ